MSCGTSWWEPGRPPLTYSGQGAEERSRNETLWNVGTCPRSLRLDARELDHLGPFVDIFGDELGELVRRVRRHRHGAEIGEPLLDVRVEHRRVGLLVERRDDLGRRALRAAETDPAGRLVALEEAVDRRHVRQEWKPLCRRHAQRPELSGLDLGQ